MGDVRAMTDAEHLREFLAARDVECPACRYNLRGLTTDRCPECNLELALAVRLAVPRMGAFIAGLVGLACGTGFSGLLLVYFVAHLAAGSRSIVNFAPYVIVTAVPLFVEGAALVLWLRGRGWFQRASSRVRSLFVLGAWVLTGANLVAFMVLVN